MSGRAGYGISISASDSGAAAVIEKLNKGIQSLTAPAEAANKALAKFGDVSGISRLNEGMQSLRTTATDTFRAIDQTGSSLGALIAPLTIAGVAELTRRWGAFGQGMTNMAHRLQLPVDALSRLQNAARLAGVPAEAMTNTLATLQDKLYGAAWNTDPAAVHILRDVLHIDPGTPGHVKNTAEALEEVAKALQNVGDPHTRQAILDALGIDRAMLPALENLQKFERQADQTGANLTQEMAGHMTELKQSWDRLALDLEGISNRIIDTWAGTITKAVTATSSWIEANKETAKSITEIATAIGGLLALKPAAWVLRLLGLGSLVPSAPVAVGAAGLAAGATAAYLTGKKTAEAGDLGFRPAGTPGAVDESGNVMSWYNPDTKETLDANQMNARLKAAQDAIDEAEKNKAAVGPRSDASPAAGGATGSLTAALGLKPGEYDAFRGSVAGIEHARYDQMGGSSGRFAGKYQMGADEIRETAAQLGERAPTQEEFLNNPEMQERYFERYTLGHHQYLMAHNARYAAMSPEEKAAALGYAHNQGAGGASRFIDTGQAGTDAFGTSGAAYSRAVRRDLAALPPPPPAGGTATADAGGRQVMADLQGHVQVDVHLRGAPAGTQANVTTAGQVRASPPRVETPMPLV
jgi:hypothetical protein